MSIKKITLQDFCTLKNNEIIVIDVRSPAEFAHAHIPLATNISLFTNDERAIVGTAYKQQSREKAIKIGLTFFGPKMLTIVEQVEFLIKNKNETTQITIVVHCWRGGMRSAAIAWLLDMYGFNVAQLIGGYKAYRNWVLQQFNIPYNFKIIGGYTGSGKTEILQQLQQLGEPIIDLEGIAKHKGSSFGNLLEIEQPSQEMFENELAIQLYHHQQKIIWIEDESQRIGLVNIPLSIFQQKQAAKLYFIDIPFEERLHFIVENYGKFDVENLLKAIERIKKRLGGLEAKNAANHLQENEIKPSFSILLNYYDKQYLKGLVKKTTTPITINCMQVNALKNAHTLLKLIYE